ncbi:hypothetical protein CHS0354_024125 [Potamilus streckersoni]|uniref:Uncharacterized protein n=1 Tax=Potamilus streckersoni TaxID=2493646 RepID=A0AAE0VM17_9BIVA|nr:hypothetical protein CHS0354_024125 [Potamilus streckersoni]
MDIFSHLQKLSLRYFDVNPVGRLITRATSDVESLNEMLSSGIVALMGNIVQIIFIAILMFVIDWRLTFVMLSVLPLMFYVTMVFKKKIQVTYQNVRREVARLNTFLQEHISGMATVQIFNRQPIQDLSDKYNTLQSAGASGDRIFSLLDERSIIANPAGSRALTSIKGCVEFRNVSFSYTNGGASILKNVSFHVGEGEVIAIVGASGSGKSTVVNLLTKLYELPSESDILIDGVSIKLLSEYEVRRHIGVVLQDVFLFSGTIMENLTLGDSVISKERVEDMARLIGIHHFIKQLPNGYEYKLSDRGSGLSGGQKQLISFLRMMLYNPKILVLDEATSSVDKESEDKIEQAMKTLMQGRTTIIIAHRFSTIERADKIIVMHKGEIHEVGTHRELIGQGGIYHKLYTLQFESSRNQALHL